MTVEAVAAVVCVVAALLTLLAIAARPEIEHRLRRWRHRSDLTDTRIDALAEGR